MPNPTAQFTESPRSLLVVQTAFLGDLLLGIPFYQRLRELWPQHRLILLCRKGLGDFFLKTLLFDEVIEIKKGDRASYTKAQEQLQSKNLEYIFSPHESLRTAFFCSSLKSKHKISFRKFWNSIFFTKSIEKQKQWPEPLRQMSLLFPWDSETQKKAFALASENIFYQKDSSGKLSAVPGWCSLSLREQLNKDTFTFQRLVETFKLKSYQDNKWIFLFPGSVWATKMWTEQGFIEVGRYFQEKEYQVFIMGGPGEEALTERIQSRIPGSLNLTGKTSIYESAVLLSKGVLVVGNDSASTHLACCADVPTVTVFGPTIIEFGFRPWSSRSYLVEKSHLVCRPCGPHGHRHCPLGTHECMKTISSAAVIRCCEKAIP